MGWVSRLPRGAQLGIAVAAVVVIGLGVTLGIVLRPGGPAPTPNPVAYSPGVPSPTLSASPSQTPSPTPGPTAVVARCPLNGAPLAAPVPAGRVALIAQIENNALARPTRNLTNADIVIEAPVEGDVTRYSAVFYCHATSGLTGPMRSARYYNIDLWQQIHGLTVAFGASNGAIARFQAAGMPQVNGLFGYPSYFQRYGTAPAPHNLYGNIESVRAATTANAAVKALASRAGTVRAPFTIDPSVALPNGTRVTTVTLKSNGYWTFGWTWDPALGAWRRNEAGTPTSDAATGLPITATSVIVQRVTESTVYGDPDPAGNPRRDIHLVGSGTGTLYVDGQAFAVRWSRPSASALTSWTYTDGSPMVLPAGPIWWEMIGPSGSVTQR
jgi:Protein of unknown function (DUF3048) N-terminal domain/Protein of unknown function (DUF3048) C-terminal domain